ncbi:MAG: hypothetical protein ACI9EF_001421 [Pseudohongiellaceae bacterium]|jgi:hypothetical protein
MAKKKDGKKGRKNRRSTAEGEAFAAAVRREVAAINPGIDLPADEPATDAATTVKTSPALTAVPPRGAASLTGNGNATVAPSAGEVHELSHDPTHWPNDPGTEPLSSRGSQQLAAYLSVVNLFFLCAVVITWPDPPVDASNPPVGLETSLLLLCLYSGGLGACIHALQSFATFMGNRQLSASWVLWYILRPLTGMSLAFMAFVILRIGLLSSSAGNINPSGIAAIGGLAGLFSKRALQKLAEVSDTVFRVEHPQQEKDGLKLGSPQAPKGETLRR